jgi:selenide, water dikinase
VLGNVTDLSTSTSALLVGLDPADDAAVYRLTPEFAVVQTVDFFTPVVDDPYDWGRVAAANALSDVYAMGGRPLLCLNLVGWPRDGLPLDMLGKVIAGGTAVAAAAGAIVAGGHSIDDREPKYGMCVTGVAHPDHLLRLSAARPGDALVLTKPLGTGILSSALKAGRIDDPSIIERMVDTMVRLNDKAALAAHDVGCRAATDVTGFGLLGHLRAMLEASQCAATLFVDRIPLLPRVRRFAEEGILPGGSRRNLEWIEPGLDRGEIDDVTVAVLADAQTSGGLLLCWPDRIGGAPGPVIGQITKGPAGRIRLVGRR